MTTSAGVNWDGLIVICAANSYDNTPMSDWHMARELRCHAPVLYVDPPVSHLTRFRRPRAVPAIRRPRLRLIETGFARLTPVVQPFPSRPATVGVATTLVRRQLRAAIRRLGGRVQAVLTGWPQYPVSGVCGEGVSAYWAKDDFAGGARLLGLNAAMLARREFRVAATADLVIAANPLVAETWRRRGAKTALVPFGNDVDLFRDVDAARLPSGVEIGELAAGFVGRLNDRTDIALLEAVADRVPLLIVGPVDQAFQPARVAALFARPGVHWAGPQPRTALPGYLRLMGAGLIPYRDSAFNRGSFPLKALEYLAAGRPVVSTGLPAIRWLNTRLITIAESSSEFAAATAKTLACSPDPERVAERRAFAAQHSWKRRATDMLDALSAAAGAGEGSSRRCRP